MKSRNYRAPNGEGHTDEHSGINWVGVSLTELEQTSPETADMVRRIVISVEQFTSFRSFTWCPLGSLHRRLRIYDSGMAFQKAVEYLKENEAATVSEYSNPQSDFLTKGISLILDAPICRGILELRDAFIRLLLALYERNVPISDVTVQQIDPNGNWDLAFWFSMMETENILTLCRGGQGSIVSSAPTIP